MIELAASSPLAREKSLLVLAGPTGAGKSRAAVALARSCNGAIINIDSRQIYRDFPIITAQPSLAEQSLAPHLLYGFLPCAEKMTAGVYADLAAGAVRRVFEEGRTPILVGGTGLYIQALLDGIADIPPVPEDISDYWRLRLQRAGAAALHGELAGADPEYAAKIHPQDSQRITRALEVYSATGRPFSWWHRQGGGEGPLAGWRVLRLGVTLTLDELTGHLARRIDLMLEQGALEEARRALEVCVVREAPGWSGIGCAELYSFLQGEITLAEAKELWRRNTRAYAKRQITWFKKDASIHWFSPEQVDGILRLARQFLPFGE